MRVSYVSCICNSLGSHEMYHCLYGKTQRCSCSGFRFVKQIILRNRSYVNMALNSRGRRMSEKIKTAIVQYLIMHLSVEAIRSKLKHFHSYMISRQGLFICITWSCEDSEELKKQQHTIVINFNSYNQLYNAIFKGVKHVLGCHLRYLVQDPILS